MWKRLRWIILLVTVVIFGFISFLYYSFFIHPRMDEQMLRKAESAVSSGITIEDKQNDLVSLKGKVEEETGQLNNPQSYISLYLDVKAISIGIDDKYLYYKIKYWGQIPIKAEKIGDDEIQGNMMKLHITDAQGKEQAILVANYSYSLFNLSGFETYYFYGPTGIEEPEDKRFAHQDKDSKMFGGPGTDYLIGAFQMEKLGLKQGQTIYMNFLGEAKSKQFHHASIDALGGHGKMAAFITWVIGSNQYQIDDNYLK
ncbi:hypothetical protein A2Y99_01560 [Candidatus Gottesmanbacteria bacterium RBG_13_37_7]|uniref:Uncharacterized protein n=1 Tax=Candidatus Gottesmanbacteria bacterium RBG_13_37_7 TaxID=1798369 RepID=A0A1F5YII4_9BACT|nr:MAG: hypothetical protein A2Y99_01560 [Candidatus Gottesmanbacteria bacterium RBG_13_37_7]